MLKIGYTAINKSTGEKVNFFAYTTETANRINGLDARNWIINHLDMSYQWDYFVNGTFKH
jgi:hypothetical protein